MRRAVALPLLLALGAGLPAVAQVLPAEVTEVIGPCSGVHVGRIAFGQALTAAGWTLVPPEEQAAALAVVVDGALPFAAEVGGDWDNVMAGRAPLARYWSEVFPDAAYYRRGGDILRLTAGLNNAGLVEINCIFALGSPALTDAIFAALPGAEERDGYRFVQQTVEPGIAQRVTTFAFRYRDVARADPPLAVADGIYVVNLFPPP
jgi:hypothetical protein